MAKHRRGGAWAWRTVLALLLLPIIAGCGGSAPYTAASLAASVAKQEKDGTLRHVVCVARAEHEYRCVGDFTPSLASIKRSVAGMDTSDFTDADWKVLANQDAGPLALDVTVADDGTWVAQRS
jgi:hypothetical protein